MVTILQINFEAIRGVWTKCEFSLSDGTKKNELASGQEWLTQLFIGCSTNGLWKIDASKTDSDCARVTFNALPFWSILNVTKES